MAKRDYYEVLGVSRDATDAELKTAYRRLAVRHHPDRSDEADAEERFKEATEAYGVLSDPASRARYDAGGHAAVGGAGGGFDPTAFSDFGDLFGAFRDIFGMDFGGFGGGGRGVRPTRGADLLDELAISFEDAALGTTCELAVARLDACTDCAGSGAETGTSRTACQACGGRGQLVHRQGFFAVSRPCPRCRGRGSVVESPCQACRGEGRVQVERTLRVRVPAGIDDGQRIRLAGEGEAGEHGGPPGDLYVEVRVQPHDVFVREGVDLHLSLPLSFPQVALGTTVSLPTLEGELELDVPAGTEAGDVLRVKGRGVPRVGRSGRGDLLVHVRVRTPRSLSKAQRKLLREYADATDESYSVGEEKSFLDRVKDMFH